MIQLKPSILAILAAIFIALMMGYVALEFAFPLAFDKKGLLDFDIFHLVSIMMAEGNLHAAYAEDTFMQRQSSVLGFTGYPMLWSYPPFFNLVVVPLSMLPIALSYVVFMVVTLGFYLWVLRALAGPSFHTVLILFLPLILLILRSGQNSFLTGGLIGLTCLLALRNSRWSGVPLGLMAIKPHLALGVGIWSLLDRRWAMAPHLGDSAQRVIQDLLEVLDEEDAINLNLAYILDGVIGEIRAAIAAGTHEDKVAIPRERLFGCDEAFETRTVLSPNAEALKAALPPLQALYTAAKQALDFAEAVRLSIRLLDQD